MLYEKRMVNSANGLKKKKRILIAGRGAGFWKKNYLI